MDLVRGVDEPEARSSFLDVAAETALQADEPAELINAATHALEGVAEAIAPARNGSFVAAAKRY